MTSSLFFGLSAALFLGLKRRDREILLWTGLLEFIILLLPLFSFDMNQEYLFFSILLFVIIPLFDATVMFAVLWVSLPIGLFYLQDTAEDRKRLWRSLVMLALVTGIIWTVFNVPWINRWDWMTQGYVFELGRFVLAWSLVFLVPLAIWAYVKRRLSAPPRAKVMLPPAEPPEKRNPKAEKVGVWKCPDCGATNEEGNGECWVCATPRPKTQA